MLEVFVPSSLCVWSQMLWRNLQTITVEDYTDDIAFLAQTPTQTESLQHSLEQAAGGIGLLVNEDKTKYMCFNQRGDFSSLNGGSLDEPHGH